MRYKSERKNPALLCFITINCYPHFLCMICTTCIILDLNWGHLLQICNCLYTSRVRKLLSPFFKNFYALVWRLWKRLFKMQMKGPDMNKCKLNLTNVYYLSKSIWHTCDQYLKVFLVCLNGNVMMMALPYYKCFLKNIFFILL